MHPLEHIFLFVMVLNCHLVSVFPNVITHSNYNYTKVSEQALVGEALQLPYSLIEQSSLSNEQDSKDGSMLWKYNIKKYELYDSEYGVDELFEEGNQIQHDLVYEMEPTQQIFTTPRTLIDHYKILQKQSFQITINNPSSRFRFCIESIVIDIAQIQRKDTHHLPTCIHSQAHLTFTFQIYITQYQTMIQRSTIYFLIEIDHNGVIVDQKVYPREVIIKTQQNHLKLQRITFPSLDLSQNHNNNHQELTLKNYQSFPIQLFIKSKQQLFDKNKKLISRQIKIPATKSIKIYYFAIEHELEIITKSSARPELVFSVLFVPIVCLQPLIINNVHIGILPDEKMIIEVPISVSIFTNLSIFLQEIFIVSTSQAVEYVEMEYQADHIIGKMRIHASKAPSGSSEIEVTIKYKTNHESKNTTRLFVYSEIRTPISVGQRRFIDVTKLSKNQPLKNQTISKHYRNQEDHRFPIRNNLNIPLMLMRVTYNQSIFELSWLQDRRSYIYPNHHREEFTLRYKGEMELAISPQKYMIILQFNGNINIPIEMIVYDHTLQCIFNQKVVKCQDIQNINFGYFHIDSQHQMDEEKGRTQNKLDGLYKSKQLVVRNWDNENKNIRIRLYPHSIEEYGINATMKIYGPLPSYDMTHRKTQFSMDYYMKGQHFLVINIDVKLLPNATTALIPFYIETDFEKIQCNLNLQVENGTIALIPQIIRILDFYQEAVEYLNLICTYASPYKILSIRSNHSNLRIQMTKEEDEMIYANQWVGIIVKYCPNYQKRGHCIGQNNKKEAISQMLQSKMEIFEEFVEHLNHIDNRPSINAQIVLMTSTGLQVQSIILIEKKLQIPLLTGATYTNNVGVYNYTINLMKNVISSSKNQRVTSWKKEKYQLKIRVRNPYKHSIQMQPLLLNKMIISYRQEYMRRKVEIKQNDEFKSKLSFPLYLKEKFHITTHLIKSILHLDQNPIQLYSQYQQKYVVTYKINQDGQKIILQNQPNLFTKQFLQANLMSQEKIEVSYLFHGQIAFYLKHLLQDKIFLKILNCDALGIEYFIHFLKAEVEHFHQDDLSPFEGKNQQFYKKINEYYPFEMLCKNNKYLIYNFCLYLDLFFGGKYKYEPSSAIVVRSEQFYDFQFEFQSTVALHEKEEDAIYLVLKNNYTSFETYEILVKLHDPQIRVFYEANTSSNATLSSKKAAHHIPNRLVVQIQNQELNQHTKQSNYIYGSQIFKIQNKGQIDVHIHHLGIEYLERSCSLKSIQVKGLCCQSPHNQISFSLMSHSLNQIQVVYNLTKGKPLQQQMTPLSVYLYLSPSANSYPSNPKQYLKLDIQFVLPLNAQQIIDQEFKHNQYKQLISYLFLNAASFLYIFLIIITFKTHSHTTFPHSFHQEQQRLNLLGESLQKHEKQTNNARILKAEHYPLYQQIYHFKMAPKVYKPVVTISMAMIKSVKEQSNKELKIFFNQSEESDIIPRNFSETDRHNLSISGTISVEHEDQDSKEIEIIEEYMQISNASEDIYNDNFTHLRKQIDNNDQVDNIFEHQLINSEKQQIIDSSFKHQSNIESSHSSNNSLPQGEVVVLEDQIIDQDSWYGFGKEQNLSQKKEVERVDLGEAEAYSQSFYSIFLSQNPLKKTEETIDQTNLKEKKYKQKYF